MKREVLISLIVIFLLLVSVSCVLAYWDEMCQEKWEGCRKGPGGTPEECKSGMKEYLPDCLNPNKSPFWKKDPGGAPADTWKQEGYTPCNLKDQNGGYCEPGWKCNDAITKCFITNLPKKPLPKDMPPDDETKKKDEKGEDSGTDKQNEGDFWKKFQEFLYNLMLGANRYQGLYNLLCDDECERKWHWENDNKFMQILGGGVEGLSGYLCELKESKSEDSAVAFSTIVPYGASAHIEAVRYNFTIYETKSYNYTYLLTYQINAGGCDLVGNVSLIGNDELVIEKFNLTGYTYTENSTTTIGRGGMAAYINSTTKLYDKACIKFYKIEPSDFCLHGLARNSLCVTIVEGELEK